jgi:hypothetical protein
MRLIYSWRRKTVGPLLAVGFTALLCCSALSAQDTSDGAATDKETLKLLIDRIHRLEDRVKQLESEKQLATPSNNAAPPPATTQSVVSLPAPIATIPTAQTVDTAQTVPPGSAEPEQPLSDSAISERMDMSKTLLRIRGFGDISAHGDTQKGDTTSFSLGELDLFITSDISDRFKFLSEVVFEGGPDTIYGATAGVGKNVFSVDVERYLLRYSHNDYFNLSVGRGHTAIGYYNTAYHHSTWLQTTTGRPLLFAFEDNGGILPIHNVGATVSGLVPSGRLGLHYVAEIGNGRESRNPFGDEPVQNEIADQNHKAFNLAAFAKPEEVSGLQTGFSVYRDLLSPANAPRIGETIFAAHAILIRPKYEFLNEALVIRHAPMGSPIVFHTPGFYSQVSEQFGSFRPYFRYQYVNVPRREPVFPDVALQHGPSLGLRYDASESVALKFQYDYTFLRDQPGTNGLTLQVGFTF